MQVELARELLLRQRLERAGAVADEAILLLNDPSRHPGDHGVPMRQIGDEFPGLANQFLDAPGLFVRAAALEAPRELLVGCVHSQHQPLAQRHGDAQPLSVPFYDGIRRMGGETVRGVRIWRPIQVGGVGIEVVADEGQVDARARRARRLQRPRVSLTHNVRELILQELHQTRGRLPRPHRQDLELEALSEAAGADASGFELVYYCQRVLDLGLAYAQLLGELEDRSGEVAPVVKRLDDVLRQAAAFALAGHAYLP